MALNLNVSPYYDDYDDTKNFNRILFKPGFAVQARELTQLQTVLQEQIRKFGDHFLNNGVAVAGAIPSVSQRDFIKITDLDAASADVSNATLDDYIGDTITGGTTGMTARILSVETGSTSSSRDLKTLYIQYTSGDGSTVASHFSSGETLTVTSTDTGRNGDTFVVHNGTSTTDLTLNYFGRGSFVTVTDGIFYINGKFINHSEQTLVLSKYTIYPTCQVGVILQEEFVTADDDATLLDPAQGSYNYTAPGADRYKVSTTLVRYLSTETPSSDFNKLVDVTNGNVTRIYKTNIYAELGKTLARRTYDESGNYTVRPFPVLVKEHLDDGTNNGLLVSALGGNSDYLVVGVESGKAYVKGFEYETLQTEYVPVLKATTTETIENFSLNTTYGNYIEVDELGGSWDLSSDGVVSLRGAQKSFITNSYGTPATAPGSQLGTARVKQISHVTGDHGAAGTTWRMYLYDIQMGANDFANVRGIYYSNGTDSGHADVAAATTALQSTANNTSLFRLPARALSAVTPLSYSYLKQVGTSTVSAGNNTATFTLPTSETFKLSSGTVPDSEIESQLIAVAQTTDATLNGGVTEGEVLDLTSATSVVSSGSPLDTLTITFSGNAAGATPVLLYAKVDVALAAGDEVNKTLVENAYTTLDTSGGGGTSGPWCLGASDVIRIVSVKKGSSGDSYADIESGAAGTTVTEHFTLNNGQNDNAYKNAYLVKNPSSSLTITSGDKIVVKYDYFTHAGNKGNFYTFESYPVDDSTSGLGGGSGNIRTEEVPIFTSPVTGQSYDLRDTVDFRVRFTDAAVSTTLASTVNNPTESTTIEQYGATGNTVTYPVPTEEMEIDSLSYYLARKDRLIIDEDGVFSVLNGTASLTPKRPEEPENAMSLAVIDIPPYPSLSPFAAKTANRLDYGVTYTTIDNRRFTMRDIGRIEKRINRLEYYTTLNLLEKTAESLIIPDGSGNDRFKNGILVDPFTGHNIGNVFDRGYHVSIDPVRRELRPYFKIENIDLVDNELGSNYVKTGDLITLPYTHASFTENPFASQTRNAVGELLFDYIGDVEMIPPVDNWTDTTRSPDLNVNFDGNYDAWENMANAWGTQWGDWADIWTGTVAQSTTVQAGNVQIRGDTLFQEQTQVVTTTTEQRQTRQGFQLEVQPETITQSIGSRVTNASFVPFMRSVVIAFKAKRLKPNTRLHAFFDGISVDLNCRQLTDAALDLNLATAAEYAEYADNDFGDPLISNADGEIAGLFRIPANTFRTGSKNFRLCDDPFNRTPFITTSAMVPFASNGLSQVVENTVVSTRVPRVAVTNVSDSRSVIESSSTENRIADREVGVVQTNITNVTNEFITINNETNITNNNITNTTINNNVTNNITNVTEVTNNIADVVEVATPTADPEEVFEPPVAPIFEIDTESFVGGGPFVFADPLAQSFYVSGCPFGCFLTKLDLYFRTKGTSSITVQIREMVNGYPGTKVVPFGEVVLDASSINVSEDASTATQITFPSPVLVQNNTEYCFVVVPSGNDPGYNLWVSELGQNQIGTTNRVTEQGNVGVLFTSSNNRTWNAKQAEDMKFKLYRADFDTTVTANVQLSHTNVDWLDFDGAIWDDNESPGFSAGDSIHSFTETITAGSGYTTGTYFVPITGGTNSNDGVLQLTVSGGSITAVDVVDPGTGYTSASVSLAAVYSDSTLTTNVTTTFNTGGTATGGAVALDVSYGVVAEYNDLYDVCKVVVLAGTFSDSGNNAIVGSGNNFATIQSVQNKTFNTIETNIGFLDFTPCKVRWGYTPTASSGASVVGTAGYPLTFATPEDTNVEYAVYSYSNEDATFSGDKSLTVSVGFNTQTSTVSPVIDTRKLSIIAVGNDINNTSTDETNASNGSAISRYISRRVNLDFAGEDYAEDLNVYLSNNIPAGTSVEVYAKLLNVADDTDFNDLGWTQLEQISGPVDPTAISGFAEYLYSIPASEKTANVFTGNGYTGYHTFAVKVVLLSSNSSVIPRVREMRAISVQV